MFILGCRLLWLTGRFGRKPWSRIVLRWCLNHPWDIKNGTGHFPLSSSFRLIRAPKTGRRLHEICRRISILAGKEEEGGGGRKRSKPDYFTRDAVCFIMPLTTFSLCFYERGRRNRKWSGRDEMRWRKLTNEEGGAPRRWIQVNLPDCKKVALFLQEALQYWLFYSFVICSVGRIFWLHCSESGIWTVYFEAHFLYLLCATFCG